MENNEKEINEILHTLNKERKRSLLLFVLTIIVGAIIEAGGFALIIVGCIFEGTDQIIYLSIGFPSFFIGSSFSLIAIKISSSYKKMFYDTLTRRFSPSEYSSLSFSFKKDISDVKRLSAFPNGTPKFDDDEAIFYEGKFDDGTSCFSYFVTRTVMGKGHPDNVYGRYIEFTLGNKDNRLFLLSPKKEKAMFTGDLLQEKINTESIAFGEGYEARALSQEDGARFLRPTVIDFLSTYGPVFSLSSSPGSVRIYLDKITPIPEVSLAVSASEEGIKQVKKEVESFALIYKEIKGSL